MKIKEYIKSNYKGWLIGILLLAFIIKLDNSFGVVNQITKSNYFVITGLKLLFLIFIISFFFFIVFSDAFGFHLSTENSENELEDEPEDLVRYKKNLRKSFAVYFISLLFWITTILTIIIRNGKTENLWKLIYLLVFPLVIFGIIVYIFNRIKTAYNNV